MRRGTYPDPDPPTSATVLPAGTVKLRPSKMVLPPLYWKWTSWKVMVASAGARVSSGAFGFDCSTRYRLAFVHSIGAVPLAKDSVSRLNKRPNKRGQYTKL